MREFDGNSLNKRLQNSRSAKHALLQKAAQAPKRDDPAIVERKAAERAIVQARRAEAAERKEASARDARESAAREAAEKAEQIELARIAALASEQQKAALAAEQKAARDKRYADRKSRQR